MPLTDANALLLALHEGDTREAERYVPHVVLADRDFLILRVASTMGAFTLYERLHVLEGESDLYKNAVRRHRAADWAMASGDAELLDRALLAIPPGSLAPMGLMNLGKQGLWDLMPRVLPALDTDLAWRVGVQVGVQMAEGPQDGGAFAALEFLASTACADKAPELLALFPDQPFVRLRAVLAAQALEGTVPLSGAVGPTKRRF